MNKVPSRFILLTTSLGLLAAATRLLAGPLNPPAGVVSPTGKPLAEIEPRIAINATNTPGDSDSLFKITQRGSYYLTGNITGVAGKHGIEIAASGVTVDLNGFDLVGIEGMGSFDGVTVTVANLTNIAVINGSVRDWGSYGIDLASTGNCRIEGVLASGCVTAGIDAGGSACVVTNCAARNNIGSGITIGVDSTITGCTAGANGGSGISSSFASSISHCTTYSNDQNGINAGSGSIITDCTARFNGINGISAGPTCVVRGNCCTSNGNGGVGGCGIAISGNDNRIEGNTCISNDTGMYVHSTGNIIVRNSCSGNVTNWDVIAGNTCLVVQASTNGSAILGNSGGTAPGSTDPNANFTY